MNAYKTHTAHQTDVQLSFFLQIPQGTPIELKIKVEPAQYAFYLNKAVLKQIEQAQKTGGSLYIPPKLLAYLWYYTCFSDKVYLIDNKVQYKETVINKKKFPFFDNTFIVNFIRLLTSKPLLNKSNLQSGLTFNSYYKQDISANKEDIVLQSNIFFYGDIFHKIKFDIIENPDCFTIVSAHYWLIEQILSSLRTKLNLLAWELASLVPAAFLTWKLHLVYSLAVSLSIFTWLVTSVVFATIRYLLVNQIPRWTSIRYQYQNWLAWGLTCLIPAIVIKPINTLWLVFFSVIVPPLAQRVLDFILPQVGKLIIRRLLS